MELINEGLVKIEIDQKFPQALGINGIFRNISVFGNARWEILENSSENSFFTSDFPAAVERLGPNMPINRIVPLAPDLAIRIIPRLPVARRELDLRFSQFRYRYRKLDSYEMMEINRLIVRCAEEFVFFRDPHPWISNFVRENSAFRVESTTDRLPAGRGYFQITTLNISKTGADAA